MTEYEAPADEREEHRLAHDAERDVEQVAFGLKLESVIRVP